MKCKVNITHKPIRRTLITFVCFSTFLLSACGSNPTLPPTALPQPTVTQRVVPTATPASTQTLVPTETPTPPTVLPTASIAPTSCATPVSVTKDDGKVSYNGMSFSYDPALAISFTAQDCPFVPFQEGLAPGAAHLAYTLFTAPSYNKRGTSLLPEIKVVAVNQGTMEGPDPRTNINPRAIPIPNYDENEQGQAIEAYNQEALRRFNHMRDLDFTPSLKALDALVASLRIEPAR